MSSRIEYVPLPPPTQVESLGLYVQNELVRIAQNLGDLSEYTLPQLNEEPPRPRDGQLVYADGTNWNPGSGKGFYGYKTGTGWVFLG